MRHPPPRPFYAPWSGCFDQAHETKQASPKPDWSLLLARQHASALDPASFAFLASRPPSTVSSPDVSPPDVSSSDVPPPPPTMGSPIEALPPELLDAVLESFLSPALLPLAGVNRRFHCLVSRLLHRRLRRAAALANHQLIFSCYHTSRQWCQPFLYCRYLGTDGLDGDPDDVLRCLPGMYSRFRPVPPVDAKAHMRSYTAMRRSMNSYVLSDTAAVALQAGPGGGVASAGADAPDAPDAPLAAYDVHLDMDEMFTQLRVVTKLAQAGPRRGAGWRCIDVDESILRVWRSWMNRNVAPSASSPASSPASSTTLPATDTQHQDVVWTSMGKRMGLRFRVTPLVSPLVDVANAHNYDRNGRPRTFLPPGEEPAVSFRLEYDEMLVRTYELLVALEEAEVEELAAARASAVYES